MGSACCVWVMCVCVGGGAPHRPAERWLRGLIWRARAPSGQTGSGKSFTMEGLPDAPGGVALSEKSSLFPLPPQFVKKAGPAR